MKGMSIHTSENSAPPPPFPQLRDLCPTGVGEALQFAREWAGAAARLPGDQHAVQVVCRRQTWGTLQFDRSIENQPLTIAGKTFAHGLGTHADSDIALRANQPIRAVRARAGMDDNAASRANNA